MIAFTLRVIGDKNMGKNIGDPCIQCGSKDTFAVRYDECFPKSFYICNECWGNIYSLSCLFETECNFQEHISNSLYTIFADSLNRDNRDSLDYSD